LVQPDDAIFTHDSDVYVEITESVPFTDFDMVRSVINEVRSRGHLFLVVDDLGAGFSNLKRIIDLEPKLVKLDRELIKDIDKNKRLQKLVASIVQLCMKQGANVVAEGIETEEELRAVIDSGAQYGQGYLFARPNNPIPEIHWPN
jgi:EAL domain-containing protein (putative c-di-GMP-specific phosphodiesterase class I)